jgi:N-acetylglucosaminyldiphosphoundecaprenol N-acetyl-beta-D-mannosaminyltransferase
MTGADWIYELMSFCQKSAHSIFFLGGERGVAEASANKLKVLYPGVSIVGTGHGYFDKSRSDKVIEEINRCEPDILLLGIGSPLQEKWMHRHRREIDAPVCWAMGAALDFVSGKVRRGPKWMTDNGLEWAFRFIVEPKRLWARYLVGNPLFMFHVLKERIGTPGRKIDELRGM